MLVQGRLAPLGMATLGKPGHAIIVKGRRPKPEFRTVSKEGMGLLWKDTWEVLEEARRGRVKLSTQEVLENFEALRDQYDPGARISEPEWTKLRDTLYNGFTPIQLLGYVKRLQRSPGTALDLGGREDGESSRWRPYTSLFPSTGDPVRRSPTESLYGFKNMRGKMMAVEVIMRDYWRLAIKDEIGEIDMRFSHALFATLQRARSEPFTAAEIPGATIELRESQHYLRIMGTEDRCLEARKVIDDAVASVRAREIDIPRKGPVFGVGDKELEGKFLDWLQRQYNIVCERSEDSLRLTINHANDVGSDIENALRTLELSTTLPLDHSLGAFTYSAETQTGNLYPVIDTDILPWTEREKKWIRWSKPVRGSGLLGGRLLRRPPDAAYPKARAAPTSKISDVLFQGANEDCRYSLTDENVREVLTASIGQSLFENRPSDDKSVEVQYSHFEDSKSRTFVSDVVHSLHFLRGLKPVNRGKGQTTCRIRLIPSPRNTEIIPPIELELHLLLQNQFLGANVTPTLGWATAVVEERNVDLLLPDTALDVRFSKTVHYDLFEGQKTWDVDHDSPVVSELRKCVANLPGRFPIAGPQPQLPAFCSLLIPRKLVGTGQAASGSPSTETTGEYFEAHYIIPPLPSLTSSDLQKFKYKELSLDFSNPPTGPLLAQRSTNLTLSLGRSEDELRPRMAFPKARLTSVSPDGEDKKGNLQYVFPQLYSRSCQLAFELGAPEFETVTPTVAEDTVD